MSTLTRVGLGALIAVGGYVGATAVVGARVKTEFETSTEAITKQLPFAKVLDQKYEKGLFSSTRTTKLQLGCFQVPPGENGEQRPREPIVITWRDEIKHGPLPGFKGIGAASVDTEFVMSDEVQKDMAKLFGKEKPLTIHTLVGWDGSTKTQIASPKATFKDAKDGEVVWAGLTGTIARTGGTTGQQTAEITMPSLEFKSPDGNEHITFNQAHFKFEGSSSLDNMWASPGKGDAELASIDVLFKPKHGEDGAPGELVKGTISNLKYHAENTLANGLLSAKGSFSGSAKFGDFVINQFVMDVSGKNLHAESYGKLMRNMTSQSLSCDPQEQSPAKALEQMQADLIPLLAHNPEYSMDRLLVEIDGKKGEMSYSFGVQGVTDADKQMPLPMLMLGKGYVKASGKLPLVWIDKLAAAKGGGNGGANPGDMARGMLEQFAAQGYVVLDQDSVSSSFSFAQGKMELNGRPFAIPGMGGGMPPGGMPPGDMPPDAAMPQ